jgi:hypothetical protein
MSDANLRRILPESESIIRPTDKIIIESSENKTSVSQFGNIIFDKNNFELSNTLESNLTLARQISGDIHDYVDARTNTIVVPEILCLYFKEFTNGTGVVIGQQSIATTNLSLNYFQVSTIKTFDQAEGIEFSVDASGQEGVLQDNGINLSPGIYKVECTGAFTLTGPAGSFKQDGTSTGNGDRGYLNLELYKDTAPNESLLVSTPIIDYAPAVKITTKPVTWCGTQAEWEFYLRNNYETATTHNTYMYGFISVCKTSNIKLKAHTAGSYIIGYPNPDSESELPPSLYNPIQIIFEKITDNPFEFNINPPEVDILSTVSQRRVIAPPISQPPLTGTTVNPLTGTPLTGTPPGTQRPIVARPGDKIITATRPISWIVPDGVTSISIVAVGAGGGGAATNDKIPNGANGGDLRWRNNISVTPRSRIWIDVGAGGTSYRSNIDNQDTPGTDGGDTEVRFSNKNGNLILKAAGGRGGRVGNINQPPNRGTSTDISAARQIGGGSGGRGGKGATPEKATAGGGGGGAGGYTRDGGDGGNFQANGRDGRGGGGGGGSGGRGTGTAGGGGGGVGLFGKGVDGDGGSTPTYRTNGNSGKTGSRNLHRGIDLNEKKSFGFEFGGGGGGKGEFMGEAIGRSISYTHGGNGAVRIIWGAGRSFPNNAE